MKEPEKKKKPSLARTMAVAGGATALGVGSGVLAKQLLRKMSTKPSALRAAIIAALPASVALGVLAAKKRDDAIRKHAFLLRGAHN